MRLDGRIPTTVLYGMLVWFGRVDGGEMRAAVMGKSWMHG